ncbi:MAG: hypothetical protein V7K35_05240 [Nostoc sp.]|uniref:hypothetical protein n=1 Tax=Nostoc sp. TaxID=1180 RepID=UPI002FF5E3F9
MTSFAPQGDIVASSPLGALLNILAPPRILSAVLKGDNTTPVRSSRKTRPDGLLPYIYLDFFTNQIGLL